MQNARPPEGIIYAVIAISAPSSVALKTLLRKLIKFARQSYTTKDGFGNFKNLCPSCLASNGIGDRMSAMLQ